MSQSSGFLGFLRVVGRGINLTRIIILNLVFFGLLALFFIGMGQHEKVSVPDASVLVLHPQGQLVEQYSISPLQRVAANVNGASVGQVRLRDLLRGIEAASEDKRITSLLLVPDELQASGFAALRELGGALDDFRATGKKVYVWSAGMTQTQYYLAAHADRIMLDPQGGILLTGLSSYRAYFKDLLDKLGITVHLFRVGQYKSAGEPFILDHASEAAKKADAYWMDGLWNTLIDEIAAARGIAPQALRGDIRALPEAVAAAGGSLAKVALNQELVDALMTRSEVRAWLREQGTPDGDDSFRQVSFKRFLAAHPVSPIKFGKKIAVVVAEGEIVAGEKKPGTINGEVTADQIRKVRNDKAIVGMVLRVNSPGGAVYPAEVIRRQVAMTRAAGKPVVVSMGDMAASGGYWISMNANRILAEPNTITGSIGIFGMYPEIPEALGKIGVQVDGVGTTPWAGAFDLRRHLDPRVGQVIQSVIDKGYRDFVGKVAAARGVSFDAIDAVAQGRVWSGEQALDRGLVDQLGGVEDAIALAAELAETEDSYAVQYIEPPMSELETFLANLQRGRSGTVVRALGLKVPAAWLQATGLAPGLKMLASLKPGQPTVMAYCFCRVGPGPL